MGTGWSVFLVEESTGSGSDYRTKIIGAFDLQEYAEKFCQRIREQHAIVIALYECDNDFEEEVDMCQALQWNGVRVIEMNLNEVNFERSVCYSRK